MARYHYTAVDCQGQPVSGELEAAGPQQALEQLASQGWRAEAADLREVSAVAGRLSPREAAELGDCVARLTKAGLPLGDGLRAMADELAGTPLGSVLSRLADRLDAGETLDAALEAQGGRLPAHLRGLVLAGVRSGRLAEALEQFAAIERSQREMKRRVRAALAYPLPVLLLACAVLMFLLTMVVPQFATIFDEFGADLPGVTKGLIWMASWWSWCVGGVALLIVVVVQLARACGPAWSAGIYGWLPIIGAIGYWSQAAAFARLMRLLLTQEVPLPQALRLAADGLRNASLAAGCRGLAEEAEAGHLLSESLLRFRQFPPSLKPLVEWGEQTHSLAEGFGGAAELFEGRIEVATKLLESVLPPVIFVSILVLIGLMVIALFLPLLQLMEKLTW